MVECVEERVRIVLWLVPGERKTLEVGKNKRLGNYHKHDIQIEIPKFFF